MSYALGRLAVFNILFVIGICAFVSTTSAQLQWWPVLRDSVYYTFTVLVLILVSASDAHKWSSVAWPLLHAASSRA